ncbi:MAG TPA: DnaB-like helicase N-terminal domain-containing protein [Candidatus Mcinerneyibacterium sp.]|nr:DnaB-like helicase N-terminal domain-containing protein [Candidatus Mcinerneyibacterium sp.]
MNDELVKLPPQAIELERVILGSITQNHKLIYKTFEIFKNRNVFYIEAHQVIYDNMIKILNEEGIIDLYTVPEMLRKNNVLDEIGGPLYIIKLSENAVLNIDYHCKIVFQKYIFREMIRVSSEISNKAFEDTYDCLELLEKGIDQLSDILNFKFDEKEHIDKIINDIIDESENIINKGSFKLDIGDYKLLEKVLIFSERQIMFLAAQPKHAKTRFIIILMKIIFQNNSNKVSLFWKAMEDGKKDIVRHLLTSFSGISYNNQKQKLDKKSLNKIKNVKEIINDWDIHISQERTVMSIIRSQFIEHVKNRPNKFNILLVDNFNICQDEIKEEISNNDKERKVAAEIQKTISMANEYAPSMAIIIDHLNKSQMDPSANKTAYRPRTKHLKGSSRKYEIVTQLVTLNYISKHKDILAKERKKTIVINGKQYNREEILKKLLILEVTDSRYSSTDENEALIRMLFDANQMRFKEWNSNNIEEKSFEDRNIISMEGGSEKMFKEEFYSISKIGSWISSYSAVFKKLGDKTTDGKIITFDYLKHKYSQYISYVSSLNEEREEKYKQKVKSIKEFIDSSMYEENFDKNDNLNYYLYGK